MVGAYLPRACADGSDLEARAQLLLASHLAGIAMATTGLGSCHAIGHALGGSGALETVACLMSIETGIIHPTINLEHPDPECDLDYVPNISRKADVRTVLKNSFGFGGQNACLVLRRIED